MDQLKAMQIFQCVAQCKSFTQAAVHLDLPKPTVTNAVQRLEQQLGTRLLQRTTRKVSLTVEGDIYLERCTRLLGELDDINGLFHQPGHSPTGLVRISLPERVAHRRVIPVLPDFLRRYPGIQLRLISSDRYADLVGEGIDCAVRGGTLRDSTLIARRVGEYEQGNFASPAYLAAHGCPQTPAELVKHTAVGYFSGATQRELDWEYLDHGTLRTLAMRSAVSVVSTDAYIAACRAGLGLIQVPRREMQPLVELGELVEVLDDWRPPPLPVSVVYPHSRHLSQRVRVCVDWLAEVLAGVS
jgi:DNA-binding transcriptional LysR family regulator